MLFLIICINLHNCVRTLHTLLIALECKYIDYKRVYDLLNCITSCKIDSHSSCNRYNLTNRFCYIYVLTSIHVLLIY